ncbi:hypothetical protein Trydic_g11018 [Trypoxylus dichotomus]
MCAENTNTWKQIRQILTRRKIISTNEDTKLARVLTTVDLTALGVGSTLGVGIYVLAGEVAKNYAGPAVVISFLIAAIASIFAGLCYAEFGARVPKAGSAYIYSYVCVGELVAFLIGWNLILEYIIGSASVVKGLFTYLDALINNAMSKFLQQHMPINLSAVAPFPDLFSLGVTLVFSVALALGAKESSMVNNVFTSVNLLVVLFVIITGFWQVDTGNWSIPKNKVPSEKYGNGGFAPYGINGIIKGAATCFYGFIGFDCIATAGEEAKSPQKSIPIAVVSCLLIVFLAYFGMSTVLTMMLPYYDQDENAPFLHVYDIVGWPVAKYVVSVGALCGLLSSLLGAMFPLPRIIYAMASDGLLFEFMGKIHPKFQTPFLGTLLAGLFTGTLSCIFELNQLFKMMAIGTLLAYSVVAACVLILRYSVTVHDKKDDDHTTLCCKSVMDQLFNKELKRPTKLSAQIVTWEVLIFCVLSFCLTVTLSNMEENITTYKAIWQLSIITMCIILIILIMTSMCCQPKTLERLSFSVPFVPWIPAISMIINIYLMTMLDYMTWIRFSIWMIIGFFIYFGYGMWHGKSVVQIQTNGYQSQDIEIENFKLHVVGN